jgi:sulfatase modifying factor 1
LTASPPPSPERLGARAVVGLLLLAFGVGGTVGLMSRTKPRRASAAPAPVVRPASSVAAPVVASAPVDAGGTAPDAGTAPSSAVAAQNPPTPSLELDGGTLAERNAALLANMEHSLGLSETQMTAVRTVFAGSEYIGQGNPQASRHPMTRAQCFERRAKTRNLPLADLRCGAPNMVPLYDAQAGETATQAKVCIDQYEFPNLECEYPVVWVRANEAQDLCHALGKRLCDAHEWEGGCAGSLKPADSEYAWGQRREMMQYLHNQSREITWAYGKAKNHALCATGSRKSPECPTPSFTKCGTNDYPAGAFPECVSPLGVFDQHGNAAEHMNFPMKPEELGSRGGFGDTEMKGSWFIFLQAEAHEDDCRWRAPDWHATRIDDKNSHRNYHLGFRCCRDLK